MHHNISSAMQVMNCVKLYKLLRNCSECPVHEPMFKLSVDPKINIRSCRPLSYCRNCSPVVVKSYGLGIWSNVSSVIGGYATKTARCRLTSRRFPLYCRGPVHRVTIRRGTVYRGSVLGEVYVGEMS